MEDKKPTFDGLLNFFRKDNIAKIFSGPLHGTVDSVEIKAKKPLDAL
jgi:hypothetical protein